ncbi:SDR family oxidoreductase [Patulibacter sp.]|uniref:SDR family oxidoreductase n=1 Tax=Patulibacter sp. TaxID=1912859 RepID=UPI002727E877|nr:SDR family oxidoreductase [Patulibacter sp.]MDO9407800.1 SDR family oxidoreductase [Patulibacter sp.]
MSADLRDAPPDRPERTAVVTGAAGATGAGIAEALRGAGWHVVGLDLAADDAGDVQAVDVTDEAAVRAAVAGVLERTGRIDLLVTAVDHRTGAAAIADLDAATWGRALDAHLRGTVSCWRAVLPSMLEHGAGSIVAVVPAEAIAGEDEPGRSAAASAVLGAVRALARELGPEGIVANAVAPKAGPWSATGDAAPADVGATVVHLADEEHYFAGQVLTPAGAVA